MEDICDLNDEWRLRGRVDVQKGGCGVREEKEEGKGIDDGEGMEGHTVEDGLRTLKFWQVTHSAQIIT